MKIKHNVGTRPRKFVEYAMSYVLSGGALETGTLTEKTITFPLDTTSPKSMHEMPWAKHKRVKHERNITRVYLLASKPMPAFPLTIRVTRLAPRTLDAHDNLPMSLAAVVDEIADALGVPDNDPRLTWRYSQEQQAEYGVRIHMETT